MPMMLEKLYDALRAADVPDDKARAAAVEVAEFKDSIRRDAELDQRCQIDTPAARLDFDIQHRDARHPDRQGVLDVTHPASLRLNSGTTCSADFWIDQDIYAPNDSAAFAAAATVALAQLLPATARLTVLRFISNIKAISLPRYPKLLRRRIAGKSSSRSFANGLFDPLCRPWRERSLAFSFRVAHRKFWDLLFIGLPS